MQPDIFHEISFGSKFSLTKNFLVLSSPTQTGIYPRDVQFLNDQVVRVSIEISLPPLTKNAFRDPCGHFKTSQSHTGSNHLVVQKLST